MADTADIRYASNEKYFPGQACAGGSRVSPPRSVTVGYVVEAGLRTDATMRTSHSFCGHNCAGNLRRNTGPNVAGAVRVPPQAVTANNLPNE